MAEPMDLTGDMQPPPPPATLGAASTSTAQPGPVVQPGAVRPSSNPARYAAGAPSPAQLQAALQAVAVTRANETYAAAHTANEAAMQVQAAAETEKTNAVQAATVSGNVLRHLTDALSKATADLANFEHLDPPGTPAQKQALEDAAATANADVIAENGRHEADQARCVAAEQAVREAMMAYAVTALDLHHATNAFPQIAPATVAADEPRQQSTMDSFMQKAAAQVSFTLPRNLKRDELLAYATVGATLKFTQLISTITNNKDWHKGLEAWIEQQFAADSEANSKWRTFISQSSRQPEAGAPPGCYCKDFHSWSIQLFKAMIPAPLMLQAFDQHINECRVGQYIPTESTNIFAGSARLAHHIRLALTMQQTMMGEPIHMMSVLSRIRLRLPRSVADRLSETEAQTDSYITEWDHLIRQLEMLDKLFNKNGKRTAATAGHDDDNGGRGRGRGRGNGRGNGNGNGRGRGRGRGRNGGRDNGQGRGSGNYSGGGKNTYYRQGQEGGRYCTFCHKTNHDIASCWDLQKTLDEHGGLRPRGGGGRHSSQRGRGSGRGNGSASQDITPKLNALSIEEIFDDNPQTEAEISAQAKSLAIQLEAMMNTPKKKSK